MNLERWIENTLKIQSIPAPTFYEKARAEFVLNELSKLNRFEVSKDHDHNVFAKIPGRSSKPLVISAHLDTVFPHETNLAIKRKGDVIIGPGIGDNAVAVGVLLELAHDLNTFEPQNDIWLVANVGEEGLGNLKGMRTVVHRFGEDVLAYLVLEGMSLGHIYNRGLPIHRYRISVTAPGGHAWIHAGETSAIHTICKLGTDLSRIQIEEDHRWSLNIGLISGGTSINTIASSAHMDIDLRAEDQQTLMRLDQKVLNTIEDARNLQSSIAVDEIGNRPAGQIREDHPLVHAAIEALHDAGIKKHQLEIGSTDASVPLSMNYPAICIGLTYGSGAHSLDERIELAALEPGYQALWGTINGCFAMDKPTD
jgi:acetylornithine deacetylase/succinyl-diaminopimelate desuccinylase-like protein